MLLDATLRLVARDGPRAATHRAVAAEAGLPLAATTYYFASRDDLVASALRQAVDDELAELRGPARRAGRAGHARGGGRPPGRPLRGDAGRRPAGAAGRYELYQAAARTPALRSEARRWTDAYLDVLAPMLARLAPPSRAATRSSSSRRSTACWTCGSARSAARPPGCGDGCGACSRRSARRPPETAAARRAPAVAVVQRARGRAPGRRRRPGTRAGRGPSGAAARCAGDAGRAARGRARRCAPGRGPCRGPGGGPARWPWPPHGRASGPSRRGPRVARG